MDYYDDDQYAPGPDNDNDDDEYGYHWDCGHFHYQSEDCPDPGFACGRFDCCIN